MASIRNELSRPASMDGLLRRHARELRLLRREINRATALAAQRPQMSRGPADIDPALYADT